MLAAADAPRIARAQRLRWHQPHDALTLQATMTRVSISMLEGDDIPARPRERSIELDATGRRA